MSDTPHVSIVICTRNRAAKLPACLAAIAGIRSQIPWELVIVDNGSTDGTAAVIAAVAASAQFPVRATYEPKPGLGRARNAGWRLAGGEFIAFTDDDCYVPPDYVDRVAALFADSEIGWGGGSITLFDPADYPITIQTKPEREMLPPNSFVPAGMIQGANMAFRRVVLDQIDGFDPTFGAGRRYCPEDVDAEARASFAGWAGLYDPSLTLAHHHGRGSAAAKRLRHTYGRGRGAYFAKLLLRRDARLTYAKHVYWAVRKQPWRDTLDELRGALGYLARRPFHRHGRAHTFRPASVRSEFG